MAHTNSIDYPRWTKRGFFAGIALFVLAELASALGPRLFGQLPSWEQTLFLDLAVVGILVAVLTPIVFGIVLPLTE